MGRSLSFYAVNTKIPHDISCKICLDLEYEPIRETLMEMLYKHLNPDVEDAEDPEDAQELREKIKICWDTNSLINYKTCTLEINKDWCPRCHMFANGLYDNPAVIASKDFSHSYSNPIWHSDWHFYNMHPGKHHSDFCNRFDSDKMYREIEHSDIQGLKEDLIKYGRAYRAPDLEAIQETQQVIKFCEEHLENPEITIIYASEV